MFDKASQASSISSRAFRDVGGVMYKGHRIERAAYLFLPRRRAVGAEPFKPSACVRRQLPAEREAAASACFAARRAPA